mmetsp:Transcript_148948/g.478618  ORF Transcript_148948/g.478618 Transcript_148948/m.478618 type:complete len:306 (+) Transcript_148948:130-1047(+)
MGQRRLEGRIHGSANCLVGWSAQCSVASAVCSQAGSCDHGVVDRVSEEGARCNASLLAIPPCIHICSIDHPRRFHARHVCLRKTDPVACRGPYLRDAIGRTRFQSPARGRKQRWKIAHDIGLGKGRILQCHIHAPAERRVILVRVSEATVVAIHDDQLRRASLRQRSGACEHLRRILHVAEQSVHDDGVITRAARSADVAGIALEELHSVADALSIGELAGNADKHIALVHPMNAATKRGVCSQSPGDNASSTTDLENPLATMQLGKVGQKGVPKHIVSAASFQPLDDGAARYNIQRRAHRVRIG